MEAQPTPPPTFTERRATPRFLTVQNFWFSIQREGKKVWLRFKTINLGRGGALVNVNDYRGFRVNDKMEVMVTIQLNEKVIRVHRFIGYVRHVNIEKKYVGILLQKNR